MALPVRGLLGDARIADRTIQDAIAIAVVLPSRLYALYSHSGQGDLSSLMEPRPGTSKCCTKILSLNKSRIIVAGADMLSCLS
jgi:hypothetical protein